MKDYDKELHEILDRLLESKGIVCNRTECPQFQEAKQRLKSLLAQTEKAYGGCRNCYGKGYATKQSFVTGGGKKWRTSPIKCCDYERGRQLEKVVAQAKLDGAIEGLESLYPIDVYNFDIDLKDRLVSLKEQSKKL